MNNLPFKTLSFGSRGAGGFRADPSAGRVDHRGHQRSRPSPLQRGDVHGLGIGKTRAAIDAFAMPTTSPRRLVRRAIPGQLVGKLAALCGL